MNSEILNETELAKKKNHLLTKENPKILRKINEQVLHKNSICTKLIFDDGDVRWIKVETFDVDGAVTRKATTLLNCLVYITSWDPIEEPLKWTKLGYFRNIYRAS